MLCSREIGHLRVQPLGTETRKSDRHRIVRGAGAFSHISRRGKTILTARVLRAGRQRQRRGVMVNRQWDMTSRRARWRRE